MYHCHRCKRVTDPNEPLGARMILSTRSKDYPYRPKANAPVRVDDRKVRPDDPGGKGWEIEKEAMICPTCTDPDEVLYT